LVFVAEILRLHLIPGLVVNAHANLFQRLRRPHRKPVLISRIEVHRDEGVIVWLKHTAGMSISNLEPIISKCSRELECVSARNYFGVRVCTENNARTQRKNQSEKSQATFHLANPCSLFLSSACRLPH